MESRRQSYHTSAGGGGVNLCLNESLGFLPVTLSDYSLNNAKEQTISSNSQTEIEGRLLIRLERNIIYPFCLIRGESSGRRMNIAFENVTKAEPELEDAKRVVDPTSLLRKQGDG